MLGNINQENANKNIMKDQLLIVVQEYLKSQNIYLDESELALQILSHPSYPSLHSLTGVLDHFNIDNIALRVSPNTETLNKLPKTFIALIQREKSEDFAVITYGKKDTILVKYGNEKETSVSTEEFLKIWSGIIVVAEIEESNASQRVHYSPNNYIYIACGILLLGSFFWASSEITQYLHFILTIAGIIASVLIVRHELGFISETVIKFCSGNESTNCQAVLNSKGATFFKHFKLSDLCVIYFTALLLAWLINIHLGLSDTPILYVSIFAIPVTIYSVYYQYYIVKKWCPLCMGVVFILWLQAGVAIIDLYNLGGNSLELYSVFNLLLSVLIMTSIWLFVRPLLKAKLDFERIQIQHYKFKRNFDIFNSLYSRNPPIVLTPTHPAEIVLGNKEAPINVILVTNPNCSYCKEAHTEIDNLLHKKYEEVRLTIRFNLGGLDPENDGYNVASRIIEIYNTESDTLCIKALNEAYAKDVNLKEWLLKWKEVQSPIAESVLEFHKSWCQENGINFTPAIYINGREFPKEYERSDLVYFTDELIDHLNTEEHRY